MSATQFAELDQLQNTIKLYLDLAGPTQQLCVWLLKVIDFLPDPVNSKIEMVELTYRILYNLGVALVERTKDEHLTTTIQWYSLRPPIIRPCTQDNIVLLADINRVKAKLRPNNVDSSNISSSSNQK